MDAMGTRIEYRYGALGTSPNRFKPPISTDPTAADVLAAVHS